jgi:hypothetical protein
LLTFNAGKHRLWYATFWNSQCAGLQPFGIPPWGDNCTTSEGGWNDAVTKVVTSAPAAAKAQVREKMCRLGELIGYEWAKDNDRRCISTDDLKDLKKLLEARGAKLDAVLDQIEQRARAICARAGSDNKRTRALVMPKKS